MLTIFEGLENEMKILNQKLKQNSNNSGELGFSLKMAYTFRRFWIDLISNRKDKLGYQSLLENWWIDTFPRSSSNNCGKRDDKVFR